MNTSIYMNKTWLILLFVCFSWTSFAQTSSVKEAEVAFSKGQYNEAIRLFEAILNEKGESAEIYYNLGNAYYRDDKIAPAILNYERALLLDPGDSDIRFNLQMVKLKTVDKIEPVGEFFLISWFKSIQNMGAADSWAKLGICTFILFIGCLILYFFSRWIKMKKISFYLGLILLVIVIVSNIFASNQNSKLVNRNNAIIFLPTVTIKSSPDASGTDLFILHEGTKVSVKSTLGEWSEIELENGNVGWLLSKSVVKI